jgi:fused signal recognition particle receptor
MFGKFKEKLKGWFSKSKETVEETAEKVEISEKEADEKKIIEKADKLIEKAKSQELEKIPLKQDETGRIYKPDLRKIKEEAEQIREEIKKAKRVEKKAKRDREDIKEFEKKLDKAERLIEKAKKQKIPEPPSKFEPGLQKFEPDIEKIKEKESFFSRIKSSFSYKITEDSFNEIFDNLEMLLLENNVALEVVEDLKKKLSEKLIEKEIKKDNLEKEIRTELKNSLNEILIEPDNPLDFIKEKTEKPFVILLIGINGTGKTTSIAKLAYFLKKSGLKVVLAAGDTFRAASIEQLSEHASNLKILVIKQNYQADPAAVGFDAIKYAENHRIDVVLIDTAGRMHTKSNLIEEMKKIVRVTNPDLKLFVAESIAGNDAVEQARTFNEAIEIDGSILSKADIDEKGGTIISVSHATNKPIFYLGTGQNYEDLEIFNKQKFLDNLLGE